MDNQFIFVPFPKIEICHQELSIALRTVIPALEKPEIIDEIEDTIFDPPSDVPQREVGDVLIHRDAEDSEFDDVLAGVADCQYGLEQISYMDVETGKVVDGATKSSV
mgnify:CR=1 FL=1